MPIDPSIALGVKPLEVANPLAQYAQLAQVQQAQMQNALAQQQMEQERGVTNYMRQANLATPEGRAGLRQFGKTGLAYEKLLSEQETAGLKRQELEGKVRDQRMTALGTGLTSVLKDPSDANLTAAFDRLDATGVDTTPFRQALLSEPDLSKRQAVITQYVTSNPEGRQALAFVQPKPKEIDLNGKVVVLDMNPNSPTYQQPVQEFGKTMRPGEAERIGIDRQRLGLEARRVGLAEEGARLKSQGLEGVSPKDLQKREAAFPQATAAIKGFEAKSDSFINDLKSLRDDPGLDSITGVIGGRTPSVTAAGRRAQALYDKIVAKGGFQMLQDMRDASKTGGALGNVSNQEGKQLAAAFAAIDRKQDPKDVRRAIDAAIADIEGSKTRMREAYDMTYQYKQGAAPAAAPTTPAKTSGKGPSVSNW